MIATAWDLEIKMIVPYDSIIFYPDEYKDEYIEEPAFKKLREFLSIEINVSEIVEDLNNNRLRNSPVFIYYSERSFDNFIILDTERDPTDQLDLITICIRCTAKSGGVVRRYAHEFYTSRCNYNIIYYEGNNLIKSLYKIDFSLYNQFNEAEYKDVLARRYFKLFKSGEPLVHQ
ncbi:hypothetical protein ACFQ88_25880 [Paenibacillus sp. NPDC056579]|uniref:hypothetical protein n=1 Tax=Paenibacillus sp. NPDC056579 TaxID=3345871 RepID=UPI0036C8D0B8